MKHLLFVPVAVILAGACSPKTYLKKELVRMESTLQEHAGFALYDLHKNEFIIQYNADRYFTPASNTKIFTFYTSLRILGDSVPALKYVEKNDTLYFQGLGDPSFLYPNTFSNDRTLSLLKNYRGTLSFTSANFNTESFGPGWAWDDYLYAYSPERSSFPIYGNLIRIQRNALNRITAVPAVFEDSLKVVAGKPDGPIRNASTNSILFQNGKSGKAEWEIPFHYSDEKLVKLLSDTLHRQVLVSQKQLEGNSRILKSIPADSLYRVMMQDSDNFIAEQLLLLCAGVVSDTLQPEIAIAYAKKNLINDLPDSPQWVDGSGLSRYNLFTPRSIVMLWKKISAEVPHERLFPLLATGGKAGTIKNLYKADSPFIFGKTGSLSNNHCLSGYLVAKSGRIFLFSFMHNNFVQPTRQVRVEMEKFLNYIRDKY